MARMAALDASYDEQVSGTTLDRFYGGAISRELRRRTDHGALESQRRAAVAQAEERFDRRLVPVTDEHGVVVLERDDSPWTQTTAEGLAALEPSFAAIGAISLNDDGTTFDSLIRQHIPT